MVIGHCCSGLIRDGTIKAAQLLLVEPLDLLTMHFGRFLSVSKVDLLGHITKLLSPDYVSQQSVSRS